MEELRFSAGPVFPSTVYPPMLFLPTVGQIGCSGEGEQEEERLEDRRRWRQGKRMSRGLWVGVDDSSESELALGRAVGAAFNRGKEIVNIKILKKRRLRMSEIVVNYILDIIDR